MKKASAFACAAFCLAAVHTSTVVAKYPLINKSTSTIQVVASQAHLKKMKVKTLAPDENIMLGGIGDTHVLIYSTETKLPKESPSTIARTAVLPHLSESDAHAGSTFVPFTWFMHPTSKDDEQEPKFELHSFEYAHARSNGKALAWYVVPHGDEKLARETIKKLKRDFAPKKKKKAPQKKMTRPGKTKTEQKK